MKPKVSIVFLNYNGEGDTIDFLKAVYNSDYPKEALEVIMVDNGSTDNSVKKIEQKFPKVKIIKLDKNYGNSSSRNVGLKVATGEYILSSDNDVSLDKSYISTLVSLSDKNPRVGIISGLILKKRPRTKIESTGFGFNFLTGSLYDIKNSGQTFQERQFLSGCAMLIRKKVFEKVGFFDGKFYLFFEDSDLCFRAREAGFKVVFTPTAKFFHGKSKKTPNHPLGKYPNWCHGLFYFLLKHSPPPLLPFSILAHLAIVPIARQFIPIDPTVKVSLIEEYKIRFRALWNLKKRLTKMPVAQDLKYA